MNRFDKKADARDIQDAKREVDLIKFAGELGYKVDDKKTKVKYSPDQILNGEAAVMVNGASQIDVFKGKNGEWAWYDRKAAEGGDVFKLYQHENPTASFVQAKEAVLGDLIPLSDLDRAERKRLAAVKEKEKQEKREADIKAGTQEAQRAFGLMSRGSASYLESRGISPEVLAATRWKTNVHGSACFPHYDADRNFSGYEYRGFDYQDKTTGEDRQAKGFSSNTEKGIYIANRECAKPTEIRFSEGGVDTLSTYQLATPEERQRILFVGTTGEPGAKTEAAIIALAERHNIRRFSMAYDRDQGGDNLTAKRATRLAERFPEAQIEDVRERIGLQIGEDPNQLVQRLQGMTADPAEIKAAPVQAELPPAAATPAQSTEPEHTAEYEAEIRPGPRRF